MKLFTLFVVLSMTVFAGDALSKNTIMLHITEPHESSVLYKNETLTVTWTGNVPPGMELIDIKLMHGSPDVLEAVKTLATNVNVNQMQHVVNLPTNVSSGNDYALAISSDPQFMTYLGNLTITDHPAITQHLSNETIFALTNSTDDNPMRLHNGRKIISLASPSNTLSKSILTVFVAAVLIKLIVI